MKKVSTREKFFLSIGVLAVVGILAYFILLPMLQSSKSGSKNAMQEMQEKLESIEKLGNIAPVMAKLETRMREQSGYKEFAFKRGVADSMIIKYVSQTASQAGINEIEQLDPKPDTSRRTTTDVKTDQAALTSLINQLYLVNLMEQMNEPANPSDEDKQADNPANDNEEENEDKNKEKSKEASEQTKKSKLLFPVPPKDIPEEVRQAMVKYIEANQGKTLSERDINDILDKAGLNDEEERGKVKNRLNMYSNRVKEVKNEAQRMVNKLGFMRDSDDKKLDRYIVKLVFKTQMDKLVRFLYNLQNTARWLKIDSMNLSIADKKQSILSIEMSMTANILYE